MQRQREKRVENGEHIKKMELGGSGHYGNIHAGRFQGDSQILL